MKPGKLLIAAAGLAVAIVLSAQPPAQPPPRTSGARSPGLARAAAASAPANPAQLPATRFPELPPASPACTNIQRVGFTEIVVVYSRPSMRHHAIFGGIIPYNDLWRTGDNASTKITFTTPVKLGPDAVMIPAGTYSLFTIPDEKAWTVILNKDTSVWGKDTYDPQLDVTRFKVAPVKLTEPVETFTIDVNDIQDDSATINLSWARVRVPVKVQVDIVNELLARIQVSMDSPIAKQPATYLQAANFYFDHTTDAKSLAQALAWVNIGIINARAPASYGLLYLKAKILAKEGDRAGATQAAQQSIALATEVEGPGTPYYKMNLEVISGMR